MPYVALAHLKISAYFLGCLLPIRIIASAVTWHIQRQWQGYLKHRLIPYTTAPTHCLEKQELGNKNVIIV